jgi:hypothetical protein
MKQRRTQQLDVAGRAHETDAVEVGRGGRMSRPRKAAAVLRARWPTWRTGCRGMPKMRPPRRPERRTVDPGARRRYSCAGCWPGRCTVL